MQLFEPWEIAPRRAMLDHSDLSCLWRYRHTLLTENQEGLLHGLRAKIGRFPNYFARKEQCYNKTAGLVLMSEWHRVVDFITCMGKAARREWGVMNSKRPILTPLVRFRRFPSLTFVGCLLTDKLVTLRRFDGQSITTCEFEKIMGFRASLGCDRRHSDGVFGAVYQQGDPCG